LASSFVQTLAGQTMNLDLTKAVSGPRDIGGLCTDLFLIIIRMREAEDLGDPASLRKLIGYYIDLFEKNCKAISMSADAILEAKYAIVALMDETVLSVPGACRDYWISRPMQLDYFGDNIAGQEFYEKLQKLLLEPENKKDVLEVYYLCLSLGFEGKYKLSNPEERVVIMDDLGRKIRRTRIRVSAELSPHGKRGEGTGGGPKTGRLFPLWLTGAIGGAVVAGCWLALFILNGQALSDLLTAIRSMMAR
jgi:type VI secretion system protein ImpK